MKFFSHRFFISPSKQVILSFFLTSGLLAGCSLQNGTRITGSAGKIFGGNKDPKTQDAQVEGPSDADQGAADGSDQGSGSMGPDGAQGSPGQENSNGGNGSSGNPSQQPLPFLQPENLVWKRYRPFEATLMQALELPKNQVCNELGQFSCVDTVHLTLLGGNEPFINGQHERAERPTVLTPIAIERIVLASCTERLNIDKANPTQKIVFKQIDLASSAVSLDQVKSQATELYRRFYGRDPLADELTKVAEILKISSAPDKVALGLCFTIGSSLENAFM